MVEYLKALDPENIANVVAQAVTNKTDENKYHWKNYTAATNSRKPYLGQQRPPQLAKGTDGSLNPNLSCNYCKDKGHMKDKCVKLQQKKQCEAASNQSQQVMLTNYKAPV